VSTLDILIPTRNRLESLVMALTGVAAQTVTDVRVILSDQSDQPAVDHRTVRALSRIIEARGGSLETHYRVPSKGIAEQRDFLLKQARADHVLYLDDDVYMEPWVIGELLATIRREDCGFVGAFPVGLSFKEDVRPDQQIIEFWDGPVTPEALDPEGPGWERWQLHRAANPYHVARTLPPGEIRRYKVAWVASCILYDRYKLLAVGGFSFWPRLPRFHSGEEVLVQNLLMRRWGGCCLLPSGTFHSELPSTVLNQEGSVDGHALDLLPEMVARYARTAGRDG
jgi:glycosyltransferase involved in cell wall biosynthesis